MNVSAHAQPDSSGSFSPENAPQVVVRAGKTFICSSCGTLVEVPPEVVGQLVLVANPSKPERECSTKPVEAKPAPKAARPAQPKRPKRESFVGQMIDGLRVPSAEQLDRAFAWVSFHLRLLDRQGAEVKRLEQLVEIKSSVPEPPPPQCAEDPCEPTGKTPASGPAKERGPPS